MANIPRPNPKKIIMAVMPAGLWIVAFEFLRNEFLFKRYWIDHYASLGLEFKTSLLNGLIWFVWSLLLACLIFILLQNFSPAETILIAWLAGFVLMWLVLFNLQVLPLKLLIPALPLSLIETAAAVLIIDKIKI